MEQAEIAEPRLKAEWSRDSGLFWAWLFRSRVCRI